MVRLKHFWDEHTSHIAKIIITRQMLDRTLIFITYIHNLTSGSHGSRQIQWNANCYVLTHVFHQCFSISCTFSHSIMNWTHMSKLTYQLKRPMDNWTQSYAIFHSPPPSPKHLIITPWSRPPQSMWGIKGFVGKNAGTPPYCKMPRVWHRNPFYIAHRYVKEFSKMSRAGDITLALWVSYLCVILYLMHLHFS